jgi:hypothetical protein
VRLSVYLAVDTGLIFVLRPGILVTWSPEGIDAGIRASLIQIYPILLSTLISAVGRHDLYIYDASFALLLTSSPLTVYMVVASICDLFWFETDLYKRIKSDRRTLRILGALVSLLWFGLSVILTLSDHAFFNSDSCSISTFKTWWLNLYLSITYYSPFQPGYFGVGLGVLPALGLAFGLCLFRRRSQVMKDFRAHREGESRLWGIFRVPWTFVKCAWWVSVVVFPG